MYVERIEYVVQNGYLFQLLEYVFVVDLVTLDSKQLKQNSNEMIRAKMECTVCYVIVTFKWTYYVAHA